MPDRGPGWDPVATSERESEVATRTSDRRDRLVPVVCCVSGEKAIDVLAFAPSAGQVGGGRLRVAPGAVAGRDADQSAYGSGHPLVPGARAQERRPVDPADSRHGDTPLPAGPGDLPDVADARYAI
jgi:hypothetical protein